MSGVDRGDDRDGRSRGQQELLGFDECFLEAKNPEDWFSFPVFKLEFGKRV